MEKDIKYRESSDERKLARISSNDVDFKNFLKEWGVMSKKHYNDEITGEEFKGRKLSLHIKSAILK